jgi:hypothetical protein
MKKLITTVCALALMVSTANAQGEKGTMTFGVSDNFTTASTGTDANVGYFIMDNIMVSASFNMDMADEGETNWGLGARYYYGDAGLFGGLNATSRAEVVAVAEDVLTGVLAVEGVDAGLDLKLQVGFSKALGFDDKLWFEPTIDYNMAGDGSLGLGAGFRLAF